MSLAFDFKKLLKKERDASFVSFDDIEVDVNTIEDRSIAIDKYKKLRANTEGHKRVLIKVNDKTLEHITQNYLNNCRYEDDVTYDGALKRNVIPELLVRLELSRRREQKLKDALRETIDLLHNNGQYIGSNISALDEYERLTT